MPDRRLLIALLLSVGAHLALVAAPGWQVPAAEDELMQLIEARLALPAPPPPPAAEPAAEPAPPAPPAPRPRRAQPPPAPTLPEARVEPQQSVPAAEAVAEPPSTPAEVPAAAPAELPAPPAAAAAPAPQVEQPAVNLPAAGRIRFTITRGDSFELGEATHSWVIEGGRYLLRAKLETTGLAALVRPIEVRQSSSGRVGPGGLEPVDFRSERGGRITEQVRFDRPHRRLFMVGGGRHGEWPMAPGSQDVLSVFYQLALYPPREANATWFVATGKSYERQLFETLGTQSLETRLGVLETLHLRLASAGGDSLELWLATAHHHLPVRVRHVDRKGAVDEQHAVELEYPGVHLKQAAVSPFGY